MRSPRESRAPRELEKVTEVSAALQLESSRRVAAHTRCDCCERQHSKGKRSPLHLGPQMVSLVVKEEAESRRRTKDERLPRLNDLPA